MKIVVTGIIDDTRRRARPRQRSVCMGDCNVRTRQAEERHELKLPSSLSPTVFMSGGLLLLPSCYHLRGKTPRDCDTTA